MKGRRPMAPASSDRRGRSTAGAPARPRGSQATGRIVKLSIGQGSGFIRVSDGPEIYFHRGDLAEGTLFNEFTVGDRVAFELIEDRFSGSRALLVRRERP